MNFDLGTFISVVLSLIVIEVLLGVDNALANASIATGLPKPQRAKALRLGIVVGAGLRLIALLGAALIIQNVWVRIIGALYLIYLASSHLGMPKREEHDTKPVRRFKSVIFKIALADLAFGLDSLITAVGLTDQIVYIIVGVMIGIATLLLLSPLMLRVLHIYPHLAVAAYVIVGVIGTTMLIEALADVHIEEYIKFGLVLLIAGYTIAYEKSAQLRKFSDPILHVLQSILSLPYTLTSSLKNALR